MVAHVEKFDVLGVGVSRLNLDSAYAQIASSVAERERVYSCVAPVSTIVAAKEDPAYREVLAAAVMVTPDGMPLVWLARKKGLPDVRRVYGPDLMCAVCEKGRAEGFRHFFLGGDDETNARLIQRLKEKYPGLIIAGRCAPSFGPWTAEEEAFICDQINQSHADIVWVGLGSPKQDFWMARNRAKLNAPVLIGVGAAFDFLAGVKPQAPCWMQKAGLEWLFRLCCEPRRLWKRYLFGNTKFIYFLFLEIFHKRP